MLGPSERVKAGSGGTGRGEASRVLLGSGAETRREGDWARRTGDGRSSQEATGALPLPAFLTRVRAGDAGAGLGRLLNAGVVTTGRGSPSEVEDGSDGRLR